MQEMLLTVRDLAARLQCSPRKVRGLLSAGKLPTPVRVGRSVRWLASEIDGWLRAGCPPRDQWEAMQAREGCR